MTDNFAEHCYQLVAQIPEGQITTYKTLAHTLGTRAYRAVGTAMHQNPYPRDIVPCHRVINSDGRVGGYAGKPGEKITRLQSEGLTIKDERVQNLKQVLFTDFKTQTKKNKQLPKSTN